MSFQAMTWAIEQKTGSPRAKCVLWSIANYANALWFSYPKQELIAEESEQSTDSVQKYLADLIGNGFIRRIKLKRFGRRTHDFLILRPSPLFQSPIEEILPHLPSGTDVLDDAAATDGSVQDEGNATASEDSESDAAATDGSDLSATLPPPAVHAAELERQPMNEPVIEPFPLTPTKKDSGGQKGEENTESCKRFERFKQNYPIPILDPAAAARWFNALAVADQEIAIAAGPRYGRACEKFKKRPKDGSKFLRDRIFNEFAEDRTLKPLVPGSLEVCAVRVLYEIAGKAHLLGGFMRAADGGIYYRKPITPQLLALAVAAAPREWVTLTSEQAAAWNSLLEECVTVQVWSRLIAGSKAPWRWPPSKDGKIYVSTGPPPLPEPTQEDLDEFVKAR